MSKKEFFFLVKSSSNIHKTILHLWILWKLLKSSFIIMVEDSDIKYTSEQLVLATRLLDSKYHKVKNSFLSLFTGVWICFPS